MWNNNLLHWYIPQRCSTHIYCFLVVVRLAFDVAADVGEARDAVDAGCALEKGHCEGAVRGGSAEGAVGERGGGGEEVGGVVVGVGVIYVVLVS